MDDLSERRPLLYRSRDSVKSADSVSSSITSSSLLLAGRRNRCKTWTASTTILLSVAFERMAFYALASNLVLFLNGNPFLWASYHAIGASLYFFGLSFIMSLVGGWIADSFFGRFKTMLLAFFVYIIGYSFMPTITWTETLSNKTAGTPPQLPYICTLVNNQDDGINGTDTASNNDPFHDKCAWLIYISLTLIAIGTGFVKANIAPFGSDQVRSVKRMEIISTILRHLV